MADFALTYGGIPFRILPADVAERIEAYYPFRETFDVLQVADRPPVNTRRLGVSRGVPVPELKLNEWYHPPTACAFSVFRGVAHADDVDAMAALALPESGPVVQIFRMEGGGSYAWDRLYMLPPRPITGIDDVTNCYLVTLVDERYFWRWSLDYWGLATTDDNDSWDDYFTRAFQGISTDYATTFVSPDAVYQYADKDSDLYIQGESAAVLIDAACANTGRVFCKNLNGATWHNVVQWTVANTNLEAARDASNRYLGGPITVADLTTADVYRAAVLPAGVRVHFPKWQDDIGWWDPSTMTGGGDFTEDGTKTRHWQPSSYHQVYSKTLTPADLGTPYEDWETSVATFYVPLRTTMKARFSTSDPNLAASVPDNQADLDALAVQLAKDYYDAAVLHIDEVYRGIVPFDPKSAVHLLFKYDPENGPTTRVWRRPFNLDHVDFQHGCDEAVKLPASPSMIEITGSPTGVRYPGVRKVQILLPSVPWPTAEAVWVIAANGETLTTGQKYQCVRNLDRYDGRAVWATSKNGPVSLTTDVTGTLPVANGGTGQSTLASGQILAGNGTSGVDSMTSTRASGETLELKLASDRWIAFSKGSY